MLFKIYLIFILYITLFKGENEYCSRAATSRVILVNSKEYIHDLSQQFVYELEDYGLCNTKLKNVTHNIARTNFFGHDIIGSISFTEGFIHTLQQVDIRDINSANVDINTNSAYMTVNLYFSSLVVFYNYFVDLTEAQFAGTVAIPIDTLRVQLDIKKFYDNDTIIYSVEQPANNKRDLVPYMDFVPANHYTEILNRDMTYGIEDSYTEIKAQWTKILGKAIEKIPFPKLCFMCKDK